MWEMQKEKFSGCSLKSLVRRVLFPQPDGPVTTSGVIFFESCAIIYELGRKSLMKNVPYLGASFYVYLPRIFRLLPSTIFTSWGNLAHSQKGNWCFLAKITRISRFGVSEINSINQSKRHKISENELNGQ